MLAPDGIVHHGLDFMMMDLEDTRKFLSNTTAEILNFLFVEAMLLVEGKISIFQKVALGSSLHHTFAIFEKLVARQHELGLDPSQLIAETRELISNKSLAQQVDAADILYAASTIEHKIRQQQENLREISDEPTCRIYRDLVKTLRESICSLVEAETPFKERGLTVDNLITSLRDRLPTRVPYRDDSFTVVDRVLRPKHFSSERDRTVEGLHQGLMATEIPTIEACAADIIDFPNMPLEFIRDMARQAWDEARHAAIYIDRLEALGGHLGMYPVDLQTWKLCEGRTLDMRLMLHQRIGEWIGCDVLDLVIAHHRRIDDFETAIIYEFVREDELGHVAIGNRWLRYLLDNDDEIKKLHTVANQIRDGLGQMSGATRRAPVNEDGCIRSGFREDEFRLLRGE